MAAFSAKDWKDYPDTSTPITAAALEDLETRVVAAGLNAITASSKKVAWGTVTVTFGAAVNSWHQGDADVTHGLGATPVAVIAVPKSGGSVFTGTAINWGIQTIGSTTFNVFAHAKEDTGSNLNTNTVAFYWLAIG